MNSARPSLELTLTAVLQSRSVVRRWFFIEPPISSEPPHSRTDSSQPLGLSYMNFYKHSDCLVYVNAAGAHVDFFALPRRMVFNLHICSCRPSNTTYFPHLECLWPMQAPAPNLLHLCVSEMYNPPARPQRTVVASLQLE